LYQGQEEVTQMDQNSQGNPASEKSDREKIVEALLALLELDRIENIRMSAIAARAGVSLHRCRTEFASVLSIVAAFTKQIDEKVLREETDDAVEESPREKLFDVLMRRFEALAPHKDAIRSLARSARCNPGLALALNGLALRSQHWMLEAADISTGGLRGLIRTQGTACLYASAMRTWLDDDDPGLSRTMAALDRDLGRAARWSRCLDDLCRVIPNPCGRRRRRRSYRDPDFSDPAEQPAVV
jgi:AcrR family transcriptional regulator